MALNASFDWQEKSQLQRVITDDGRRPSCYSINSGKMIQRVARSARPALRRAAHLTSSQDNDPLLALLEQVAAGKVRILQTDWFVWRSSD